MLASLADLAARRPWSLLAANLVALAAASAIGITGSGDLPIGSLAPSGAGGSEPDLVIATTGQTPVHSGVYGVALRVISSQVQTDAAVADIRRGPVSSDGRSTSLLVSLSGGADARQQTVERIEAGIDPGPLQVSYGGEVATLLDARHELARDFWKLELLAMPFVALVLALALGPRLAAAPLLSAATAIAGALAGLVILGKFADVSLLGIAPAAVVGLVLGVEAPCALFARYRAEAATGPPEEALTRVVQEGAELAVPVGVAAALVTVGLLATSLDQAASMVLGCAVAAALALVSTLICTPAVISLARRDEHLAPAGQGPESPLVRVPAALAGYLASPRVRTVAACALAAVLLIAAAMPMLHGDSRPFSALDLPADAPARAAAELAGSVGAVAGGSIFADLPLAAGVSVVALGLVLWIAFRTPRVLPVAVVSLLPAAAACGLCVLVFQDGDLAGAVGQARQGALETGAVASLVAALASVSAARGVAAIQAAGEESSLDPSVDAAAAASLVVPAALLATVIAAAATGVLGGADLYPAREFGLAIAIGLLLDLVLVRSPLIAALARRAAG